MRHVFFSANLSLLISPKKSPFGQTPGGTIQYTHKSNGRGTGGGKDTVTACSLHIFTFPSRTDLFMLRFPVHPKPANNFSFLKNKVSVMFFTGHICCITHQRFIYLTSLLNYPLRALNSKFCKNCTSSNIFRA